MVAHFPILEFGNLKWTVCYLDLTHKVHNRFVIGSQNDKIVMWYLFGADHDVLTC